MIEGYKIFLDKVFQNLETLGLDLSQFTIDHIAYLTESMSDYEKMQNYMRDYGEIKHDVLVGKVRVTVIQLFKPLDYKKQKIEVIEIISPKDNGKAGACWEHIELIYKRGFDKLISDYPDLAWDTSVIDREIFPMLTLRLDNGIKVKFPKRPVLEEVERIILT